MNPFNEKACNITKCVDDWKKLYPTAYDKHDADAYTKVRTILMNGTEFEQNWFMHQLCRHTADNDLRRDVAFLRNLEQQQQKRLSYFKPKDETVLETTISYEQLAVDLTAILAQTEKDKYVKAALDFALLEDFDHLYRFSDLLEMEQGISGEKLVGSYTEIMPGRPTIAEHRHPFDNVRRPIKPNASLATKLHTMTITAAEQQTMNYYMNIAQWYKNDLGRKLYAEIAMIEEAHVTQYESLKDPTLSWLEQWVMHEYCECWLYYSAMEDEADENIKKIWSEHYKMEVSHLKTAVKLLNKYENKTFEEVCGSGEFPKLLKLGENKDYIRRVLGSTVTLTADNLDYRDIVKIPDDHRYFNYQKFMSGDPGKNPSHLVIQKAIDRMGKDYRYQDSEHPVKSLRDRKNDNIDIARTK